MFRRIRRTPWANSIRVAPVAEPPAAGADPTPPDADQPEHGYFTRRAERDDEFAELRSLVSREVTSVGGGTSARARGALDSIVDSIRTEEVDVDAFGPLMKALARNRELVRSLSTLDSFDELIHLVTLSKHRRALDTLRDAAADPTSTADSMMAMLSHQWWVFGGSLTLRADAWDIDELPDRCLPLVRFDRAVHLVLVESPHVDMVRLGADGAFEIDPAVYKAFDRARHLVGRLQDRREDIQDRLTFKASRASVSVVIGYPSSYGLSRDLVREKIRELNTFTVGFTVVTYDELINLAADRLPAIDA